MADDGDFNVKVKLGADLRGGVQTRDELKKIHAKVKQVSSEASNAGKSGFGRLGNCINGATSAMSKLRAVMTGFGILGIVQQAITLYQSLKEIFEKDTEKARALNKEMQDRASVEQVNELKRAYDELIVSISAATKEREREKQVFNEEVLVRRDAEDAEMAADEADALAAVDPNAEDADRQRQRIMDSFNARRARRAADRKKEDVVFRRQELQDKAETATTAADRIESTLEADDKAILRARIRASVLEALSKEKNDKDGTWYNWNKKTEEGDAVREQQRKDAESARQQVERLEADRKTKEKEIEELRAQAAQALKIRDVIGQSIDTAELVRETANVSEDTAAAQRDAGWKREDERKAAEERRKAAEKVRQEKELADAQALLSGGDARAESLRSRIDANNRQITATSFQVASGSMASDAGARAVAELQSQNTQLNELLSALLRQIEQSKRVIERANERARNSSGVDDSSEGA